MPSRGSYSQGMQRLITSLPHTVHRRTRAFRSATLYRPAEVATGAPVTTSPALACAGQKLRRQRAHVSYQTTRAPRRSPADRHSPAYRPKACRRDVLRRPAEPARGGQAAARTRVTPPRESAARHIRLPTCAPGTIRTRAVRGAPRPTPHGPLPHSPHPTTLGPAETQHPLLPVPRRPRRERPRRRPTDNTAQEHAGKVPQTRRFPCDSLLVSPYCCSGTGVIRSVATSIRGSSSSPSPGMGGSTCSAMSARARL